MTMAISLVILAPIGWLCDRFSALKVGMFGFMGMQTLSVISFFFIHDKKTMIIMAVLSTIISCAWGLGSSAINMAIFPHGKFGQFFAATNIFGCGISILGNSLAGTFMDAVHHNYRMAYLWQAIGALALIPLFLVYRDWKRFGGPDHYEPPEPPE